MSTLTAARYAEIYAIAHGGSSRAAEYRALSVEEREAYAAHPVAPVVHIDRAYLARVQRAKKQRAKMFADLADLRDEAVRALTIGAEMAR